MSTCVIHIRYHLVSHHHHHHLFSNALGYKIGSQKAVFEAKGKETQELFDEGQTTE